MLIQFDTMETSVVPHLRDGEGEVLMRSLSDEHNKIMKLTLAPGCSVGLHTHEGNSEIMYILSGSGKVLYDGAWETLSPGVCHYCPKGHSHSTVNDGTEDLVFFAVVPEQ